MGVREREGEKGSVAVPNKVYITSFGFKHGAPPKCDVLLDMRFMENPHHDPTLRTLTGLDAQVQQRLKATPNARELLGNLSIMLRDLSTTPDARIWSVAIGCYGGRHRSVAAAEILAADLRAYGSEVSVTHRDIHKGR